MKEIKLFGKILSFVHLAPLLFLAAQGYSNEPSQEHLDSLINEGGDLLESKVRSTLMFGGSSPVSFMGEARLKVQDHSFSDYPLLIKENRNWTAANWEGNESMFRLGMVVRPNRNTVLWSKIGFQNTMPGIYLNPEVLADNIEETGFSPVQTRHDKSNVTANIHEDMSAGIALRSTPASAWLKMGNVLWTQSSPLTIWKTQPRTFAWDYLPFEIEQPISRYYEYNIAKGEKSGRSAWNKKPFNGIQIESINLPWDLYFNFVYGTLERYDNFEEEYVDWSNDVAYADQSGPEKALGYGDSYRHLVHFRLSHPRPIPGLKNVMVGLNYAAIRYRKDVFTNAQFIADVKRSSYFKENDRLFYKNNNVLSVDLKGDINPRLSLHMDVAFNLLDTTFLGEGTDTITTQVDDSTTTTTFRDYPVYTNNTQDLTPAVYAKITSRYFVPVELDLAYISPGFYSPFSFSTPLDAFYPFGSNLVGPGKFISRGEGSSYTQNMMGAQISVKPEVGYGHLKIIYGQHKQIQASRDMLYLPYRLIGQDLSSVFHTSYTRWGNGLVDGPLDNPVTGSKGDLYLKRLGDMTSRFEVGGYISDFLSFYEGFVPFESAQAADSNFFRIPGYMPSHVKWTYNFAIDASYDISDFIGYANDFFLGGYLCVNGISTEFTPMAFSGKDQMLWSIYSRFEPAIAITPKFYILGLLGYENWQAPIAYMKIEDDMISRNAPATMVPIDYVDMAYGIGFDWDFAARMGLHGRLKWISHEDKNYSDNNWKGRFASGEIKFWF